MRLTSLILLSFLYLIPCTRADTDSLLADLSAGKIHASVPSLLKTSEEYLLKDPVRSRLFSREALEISIESHTSPEMVKSRLLLGKSYFYQGMYDSAEHYLNLAKSEVQTIDNDTLYCEIHISLGACAHQQARIAEAIGSYFEALEMAPFAALKGKIFHNMTSIYREKKDYDAALEYSRKSLEIFRELGDSTMIITGLNTAANIKMNQKNFDEGLELFEESLRLSELTGNDMLKILVLSNIGDLYLNTGKAERALWFYRRALHVNEKLKIVRLEAMLHKNIGSSLKMRGLTQPALTEYRKAEEICSTYGYLDMKLGCLKAIHLLLETSGNYKDAYRTQTLYLQLKDSLQQIDDQTETMQMQARFDSQVKEMEILRQESEIQRLTLLRKNTLLGILLLGFVIGGGMIVFIYNRYLKSKELNKKLESQNSQIQNQNFRIANQNKKLEYSNQELRQFAYIVSHDLREPLRTIANYSTLFAHRYKALVDHKGQSFIDYAVRGVHHMQHLLDELLNYVVIQTRDYSVEAVDLNYALDMATDRLYDDIARTGTVINAPELPQINSSPLLMEMLFQHLISNAIHYRSEKTPEIHITFEKRPDELLISFQDNGMGMEEHHLEKIFSIFYQINRRDETGQTGIGLAICQKIVRLHGGWIKAESEPGKGTKISLSLSCLKRHYTSLAEIEKDKAVY